MGCICLGVKKITHLDIIKERKKEEGASSTALQLQKWSGNASLIKSLSFSLPLSLSLPVRWNLFPAFQSPSIQFGHPFSRLFPPLLSSRRLIPPLPPLCTCECVTVLWIFSRFRGANSNRPRPRSGKKTAIPFSPKCDNLVFSSPLLFSISTKAGYTASTCSVPVCFFEREKERERDSSPGGNLLILLSWGSFCSGLPWRPVQSAPPSYSFA